MLINRVSTKFKIIKSLKVFNNKINFHAVYKFLIILNLTQKKFRSTFTSFENNYSSNLGILRILRLVQMFRITRHSIGLQVLLETFVVSSQELMLMGFFLIIGIVLFSSGMYFAEVNEPETGFTSIPGN